jgi:hypothetical protein
VLHRFILVGLLFLAGATQLSAQDVPDSERAERLRQTIEDRFTERLARDLGLSDQVAAKVQGVLSQWAARRRGLERDERRLRQELAAQMRPGVAADEAVVLRAMNAMLDGRIAYVQTFKDEQAELAAVLTPVQRAQYVLLRDRLAQRAQGQVFTVELAPGEMRWFD